jgi:hypothetical protein
MTAITCPSVAAPRGAFVLLHIDGEPEFPSVSTQRLPPSPTQVVPRAPDRVAGPVPLGRFYTRFFYELHQRRHEYASRPDYLDLLVRAP